MKKISKNKKIKKPKCYNQNDDVYPLCKGTKNALYDCNWCCLYENYAGDEPPME